MNSFVLAYVGGILGALLMDITEAFAARAGLTSGVSVALVGRWFLGLMQGRLVHVDIQASPSLPREVGVTLQADDAIALRWGQLHAIASGYDKPDHVRVELVPNSGNVLEFVVKDGKAEAIVLDGMRFAKTR